MNTEQTSKNIVMYKKINPLTIASETQEYLIHSNHHWTL